MRHLLAVHEDEEEEWQNIEFGMRILKSTRTAFERQILESVLIQKSRQHNIMNNKAEYNRFALPRLTAKLGEKDLDKWRAEDREEMLREATIEENIRIRKKEKSKKRGEGNRRMDQGQPKRKKLRLDEDGETQNHSKRSSHPEVKTSTPKKRKDNKGTEEPAKKKRPNYDIKRYITCKRWK